VRLKEDDEVDVKVEAEPAAAENDKEHDQVSVRKQTREAA